MAGVDIFVLAIYLAQQAGIVLAVGAETVVLCAYLLGLHNKTTEEHNSYAQAARFAQSTGLVVVVVSGLGAVMLHAATGAWDVLLAPAFIFKWILIGVVLAMYGFEHAVKARGVGLEASVRGAAGGNWYALFLVHSVAPVAGWMPLLILYALWMAGFGVVWGLFVLMMRRAARPLAPAMVITKPAPNVVPVQKAAPVVAPVAAPVVVFTKPAPVVAQPEPLAIPKHIEPKPAPEAPHAPLPVLARAELEAPHQAPVAVVMSHTAPAPAPLPHPPAAPAPKPPVHIAAAPAPAAPKDIIHRAATPPAPPPKEGENLSAVRVMPKSPDELPKAMIQFG